MNREIRRILRAAQTQGWELVEWFVRFFPGPVGTRLRSFYWKCRLRFMGKDVRFGVGVRIYSPEWVRIGDHAWIDDYVIILAGPLADEGRFVHRKPNSNFTFQEGEIRIGERVHIAPFVQLQGHGGLFIGDCLTIAAGAKIYTLSHHHRDLTGKGDPGTIWKFVGLAPAEEQALICAPVVIQDNAAVGLNSVVFPGSTIGQNSWLGAMSLLQGEIPPNAIATGIPAIVVKDRFR